jgi:hypothetical protein
VEEEKLGTKEFVVARAESEIDMEGNNEGKLNEWES